MQTGTSEIKIKISSKAASQGWGRAVLLGQVVFRATEEDQHAALEAMNEADPLTEEDVAGLKLKELQALC